MLRPEIIDGRAGRLFALTHAFEGAAAGAVVVVPPFAEEMNKSRRMLTLFAQAALGRGHETVIFDPWGTGDSDGDFDTARWDVWCDDLQRVLARTAARLGRAPALLALRSGALLASAVLHRDAKSAGDLLLWAPVTDGDRFMKQFLRLRIAATLSAANRESVADLENSLRAGRAIEVAGYSIAPGLWSDVVGQRFAPPATGGRAGWFDVVATEPAELSPATQKSVAALRSGGWSVETVALTGPAFWGTAEIAEVPSLVAASVAFLRSGP